MKTKIAKILGVVLSVALLSSLAIVAAPVAAAPGVNAFDDIALPSSEFGGTDVTILAFNADGSIIYAAVYDGDDWALMKSEDGGFTWDDTTMDYDWYDSVGSLGDIVDIVVSPMDDTTIYVAYESGKIYKVSDEGDGGISVVTTIKNEEGVNATALYDIDIYFDDSSDANYILAATNIDALVYKDAGLFEEWVPLSLIDYCGTDNIPLTGDDYVGAGVLEATFAPDFASSSIIWAVYDTGNDNMSTGITNDVLSLASTVGTGTWNTVFDELIFDGLDTDDEIPASTYPVDMAFPTGYSSTDPYLYLALVHPAVDDGNLYLCVIDDVGGDSEADGLLAVEDDICSVEVYGEVILAGALGYGSNYMGVYRSDNGGDTFDFIDGPSGETNAYVYMMPGVFSATEGTAFCTSTGDNSALSRSTDGGQTWTQIGLIDVDIDTVIDVAFITQGAEQEALLITRDIPYRSLWRTDDITAANVVWERLIISPYAATDPYDDSATADFMMLDIEVSMDGATVMMYIDDGVFSGDYSILKSTDNGYSFTHWRNMPDDVEDINDWIVYDGSTIYCATDGGFYGTSRFGPATKELAGESLVSVALQPDFDPDDVDNMVVAVGNDDGGLFVSTDKGENWGDEFGTPGSGWVTVAFDAMFADNGLLYYCTEGSLVGQALVDDNEVDGGSVLTKELLDSEGDDAGAKGYSGLIVAPDNALYVIGANEVLVADSYFEASGTIRVAGENQKIEINAVIQLMSDYNTADVVDITYAVEIPISGVVGGPFVDGEILHVIGDSLTYDNALDVVTGNIQIQGVTSGATGWFNSAASIYAVTTGDLSSWADEPTTVSITSANMFAEVNYGTITLAGVDLDGTDWVDGETLDVTGWSLVADGSGDLGGDADSVTVSGAAESDLIDLDESGVTEPTTGTFDASETVNVVSSSLTVEEIDDSSWEDADSAMYRLLLHEPDNIWEEASLPYAGWYTWYSEGTNIIWNVVDGDMLYAFEDFLSGMVQDATATEVNVSPATATKDVAVSWTHLKGAWEYEIKFTDGMFWYVAVPNYDVPAGKTAGDTLTAVVQDLDFATEYDFYVRVAVGEPYMSRWSAKATEVTGWYILPPNPEVPAQGLQGAPLLPSFVWEAAYGAASYDFQLSTSPSFASLLVDINTTDTGYTATTELAYDTNHYWRVRSVAPDGTKSAWCTIQNFHTRTEEMPPVEIPPQITPQVTVNLPAPQVTVVVPDVTVVPPDITVDVPAVVTVTQPPPTTFVLPTDDTGTPVYIWIIVAIGAVLTIAVIVLIIRTRRVV